MGVASDLWRAHAFTQLKKTMAHLGVNLGRYEETMDALKKKNPRAASSLESSLKRLGIVSHTGDIDKGNVAAFTEANKVYQFQQERIYGKWFMGLGAAAQDTYKYMRRTLLAGFSLSRMEKLIDVTRDSMETSLRGMGKLDYSTADALSDLHAYSALHGIAMGTAAKYGFNDSDAKHVVKEYTELFGTDKLKAEKAFSTMFAYARTSGKDVREVYHMVEKRAKKLGTDAYESANQLLDGMMEEASEVNAEMEGVTKSLEGTPTGGKVWRKDFLDAVTEVQEASGHDLVPNEPLLAQLMIRTYQEARKFTHSYKELERISKGFASLLKGPSYVEYYVGIHIFREIEKEIGAKTKGLGEVEAERIQDEVVAKYVGKNQLASAKTLYSAMRGQANLGADAPMAFMQLAKGTKEGMALLLKGHAAHLQNMGSNAAVQELMERGMSRTEALITALAVREGSMAKVADKFVNSESEAEHGHESEMEKDRAREIARKAPMGIVGWFLNPVANYVKNPLFQFVAGGVALAADAGFEIYVRMTMNKQWLQMVLNITAAAEGSAVQGMQEQGVGLFGRIAGIFKTNTGKVRWGRVTAAALGAAAVGTAMYYAFRKTPTKEEEQEKKAETEKREKKEEEEAETAKSIRLQEVDTEAKKQDELVVKDTAKKDPPKPKMNAVVEKTPETPLKVEPPKAEKLADESKEKVEPASDVEAAPGRPEPTGKTARKPKTATFLRAEPKGEEPEEPPTEELPTKDPATEKVRVASQKKQATEKEVATTSKKVESEVKKPPPKPVSVTVKEKEVKVSASQFKRAMAKEAGHDPRASRIMNYLMAVSEPTESGIIKATGVDMYPNVVPPEVEKVSQKALKVEAEAQHKKAVVATYAAMGARPQMNDKGQISVNVTVPNFVKSVTAKKDS